jgi:hypothetical protein
VALQVLPQVRAGTVDFIAADEVEREAVAVGVVQDVDGKLSFGAEPQADRQSRD